VWDVVQDYEDLLSRNDDSLAQLKRCSDDNKLLRFERDESRSLDRLAQAEIRIRELEQVGGRGMLTMWCSCLSARHLLVLPWMRWPR
jgi:hypothetical protein